MQAKGRGKDWKALEHQKELKNSPWAGQRKASAGQNSSQAAGEQNTPGTGCLRTAVAAVSKPSPAALFSFTFKLFLFIFKHVFEYL